MPPIGHETFPLSETRIPLHESLKGRTEDVWVARAARLKPFELGPAGYPHANGGRGIDGRAAPRLASRAGVVSPVSGGWIDEEFESLTAWLRSPLLKRSDGLHEFLWRQQRLDPSAEPARALPDLLRFSFGELPGLELYSVFRLEGTRNLANHPFRIRKMERGDHAYDSRMILPAPTLSCAPHRKRVAG